MIKIGKFMVLNNFKLKSQHKFNLIIYELIVIIQANFIALTSKEM